MDSSRGRASEVVQPSGDRSHNGCLTGDGVDLSDVGVSYPLDSVPAMGAGTNLSSIDLL